MDSIEITSNITDLYLNEEIQLNKLYNLFGFIIAYTSYYILVLLMLHSIYMDIKQGIFSIRDSLVYYYEDRDYICIFVGRFIASLF
jgi:hypothetical protein